MKKITIIALVLGLSLLCGNTAFAADGYPEEGYGQTDGGLEETRQGCPITEHRIA